MSRRRLISAGLYNELQGKLSVVRKADRARVLALMDAVKDGEFDATREESERWAASKEGQETMRLLRERR